MAVVLPATVPSSTAVTHEQAGVGHASGISRWCLRVGSGERSLLLSMKSVNVFPLIIIPKPSTWHFPVGRMRQAGPLGVPNHVATVVCWCSMKTPQSRGRAGQAAALLCKKAPITDRSL